MEGKRGKASNTMQTKHIGIYQININTFNKKITKKTCIIYILYTNEKAIFTKNFLL